MTNDQPKAGIAASFRMAVLLVAALIASCGESDPRSPGCEQLLRITIFPYPDDVWLTGDHAASPSENADSVEFLQAALPFGRTRVEHVGVSSRGGISVLSVSDGEVEQVVVVRLADGQLEEEADMLADLLDVEAIPSEDLRNFGRLDFDDQLTWYRENGQVSYECTRSSAVRDFKKYLVEEKLGHMAGMQFGSASIGRFGVDYLTDSGSEVYGISESDWLISGLWVPSDPEFERAPSEPDAHDILMLFEAFVLGRVSADELRSYLDANAIEHEFNVY